MEYFHAAHVKVLQRETPAKTEDRVRYSKSVISAIIEQTFLYVYDYLVYWMPEYSMEASTCFH
jgi:hypothetical protein